MNTSVNSLPGLPGPSLAEVALAAVATGVTPPAAVSQIAAQTPPAIPSATAAQAAVDVAADARKAEQTRIAGIIGHAEASGRESLAQHLAFSTTMTVEAAAAALAAAPKAGTTPPAAAGPTPVQALAGQVAAVNIGAAPPAAGDAAAVSSAWKTAIDTINRGQAGATRR